MLRFRRFLLVAALALAPAPVALAAPATAVEVKLPPTQVPGTTTTLPGAGVNVGPGGVNLTVGEQPPAQQPPAQQPPAQQSPAQSSRPAPQAGPQPPSGGAPASKPSSPSSGGRAPDTSTPSAGEVATAANGSNTALRTARSGSRARRARALERASKTGPAADAKDRRSTVERIVERIPTEFLAALCAAFLAAIAFALVWLRERRRAAAARREAMIDPLTKLPNRLAFYERLANEWRRTRRYDRPLGLLMLDMDGLKRLNDGGGHAAGDRALILVGEALAANTRQSDLAARLAGDEFVVLCPETSGDGLDQLADKLRARLDAVGVGMSVGAAEYVAADQSPEDMLARADHAMYDDKLRRSGGREATGPEESVPRGATARPDFAISAIRARPAS